MAVEFVTLTFSFTFPANPPVNAQYTLYIDDMVQGVKALKNPGSPQFAPFDVKGAPGSSHVAEVRVVDLDTIGPYNSNPLNYGTQGELVSPAARLEFKLPGTPGTGNALANAIIRYILNSIDYIEKTTSYTCNIIAVTDAYKFVVNTFSSGGGTTASTNYSPFGQGYAPYEILASTSPLQLTDAYPLGSQIHLEIAPLNIGNIQIGPVQIIDFTAGQPMSANPVTISNNGDESLFSGVAYAQGQIAPNDPSANTVTIFGNGGFPQVDVNFQLPTGATFTITAADFDAGSVTVTSGPIFDAFYGQPSGPQVYYVLDATGTIIQAVGTLTFTAHQ